MNVERKRSYFEKNKPDQRDSLIDVSNTRFPDAQEHPVGLFGIVPAIEENNETAGESMIYTD